MCYSVMISSRLEDLAWAYEGKLAFEHWDIIHGRKMQSPDLVKFADKDSRIFPHYFAPVMARQTKRVEIFPMRYSVLPPPKNSVSKKPPLQPFNARRDNLQGRFWADMLTMSHGLLVVESFFEWVTVPDLLAAGQVTRDEILVEFDRQQNERRAKILSSGKKWHPTPTELKNPEDRRIVVEFLPDTHTALVCPVVYNHEAIEGVDHFGFAIVTDEPHPDVIKAGHDRTPVYLDQSAGLDWLNAKNHNRKTVDEILSNQPEIGFLHRIPVPVPP